MTVFDRITTGCARFVGRPEMLAICVVQSALGAFAYFFGGEGMTGGVNLLISVTTLLMLPMLQASQNRDGAAMQLKIDELIRVNKAARDSLMGIERKGTEEIEAEQPKC